jgi:hypothetical protein
LYTAESELTAAFEARAVRMRLNSSTEVLEAVIDLDSELPPRKSVVHVVCEPVLFVNLEHRSTALEFGLDPNSVLDRIEPWRVATHSVWEQLNSVPAETIARIVGVCHQSKLRGSNGWNFGIFHGLHSQVLTRGDPVPFELASVMSGDNSVG